MDSKPYKKILDTLKDENDLSRLTKEVEECFYLDYKQGEKDDYAQSRSIKGSDLDNIAKSISGFGNALGGMLIFGVDKNKNLKPFRGYKIFKLFLQKTSGLFLKFLCFSNTFKFNSLPYPSQKHPNLPSHP